MAIDSRSQRWFLVSFYEMVKLLEVKCQRIYLEIGNNFKPEFKIHCKAINWSEQRSYYDSITEQIKGCLHFHVQIWSKLQAID